MARRLALALVLALAVAGCDADEEEAIPVACTDSRDAVHEALAAAPGPVALHDGTRLSECVRRARTNAELQSLGVVVTGVADDLEVQARDDPSAALRLGYLIGAARAGAAATTGIGLELARRLERTGTLDGAPAAAHDALRKGLRAGEATG